jgi:Xaa-Pro aminopeptidase
MVKIPKDEFKRRRQRLMEHMGPNSIAIVPAAREKVRSRDTHFPFRQDSDFQYLTGFPEPDAVAVLVPGRAHGEYVLFCRDKDKDLETWHGRRFGPEGAREQFAVDDAFPIDDIDDILPGLIEGRDKIFYALGADPEFDDQVMQWVNTLRKKVHQGALPVGEMIDIRHILHDMRLYKSKAEIDVMRHAAEVSAQAHVAAMRATRPGRHEWEIEAELKYRMALGGCRHEAYGSIVAGGDNATILHYTENQDRLRARDLLLVDAGGEYQGYAADITRTWPVNGRFSRLQKRAYEWVLKAQLAAIAEIRPGSDWARPHEAAVRVLTEGMVDLGLLKGQVNTLIKKEAYRRYYMHKTGHWIGLDVHDVGDYQVGGRPRTLEPGMVMTVEPGLYVPADDKKAPEGLRGMGIRIEDDVLVTDEGCEVLTASVPKTVAEIEACMADGMAAS